MPEEQSSIQKKSVQVRLDTQKCIGNGACQKQYPQRFFLSGEKAELIGGTLDSPDSVLNLICNSSDFEKVISAAESCPVNAIRVIDMENNVDLVQTTVDTTTLKVIQAQYDDLQEFVMDPKGYFLIDIDREKKEIMVGFCPQTNKVSVKIVGTKPLEIYQTIIKEGLISRYDHGAYLGRELQKAHIALQEGIIYIQDDELDFEKK